MSIVLDGTTGISGAVDLTTTGNTILGNASTDTLNVGNGGLVKDASGNVGIGTTSPAVKFQIGATGAAGFSFDTTNNTLASTYGVGGGLLLRAQTVGNTGGGQIFLGGSARGDANIDSVVFSTNNAEHMHIDASGNVSIGTANAIGKLGVVTTSETFGPTAWGSGQFVVSPGGTGTSGGVSISFDTAVSEGAITCLAPSVAWRKLKHYASSYGWNLSGAGSDTMTLDASGHLLVGGTVLVTAEERLSVAANNDTQGTCLFYATNNSRTNTSFAAFVGIGDGFSTAGTTFRVGKNNATGRSLNAGGTLNASGADYAEYMTKADDFVLAKGDVVGIDANGKLTNVFANAISFVVKSTDPSYVGGDSWGSQESIGLTIPKQPIRAEDDTDETFAKKEAQYTTEKETFDEALEAARQLVDRIAFAGQVPVNVLGATAGQYIIPVNDNGAIKGEAVSSPTFEQYQTAVGKVIAIEADGRAKIIVKVA